MSERPGTAARSLVKAARGALGPPAAPGVRQAPVIGHPLGLGTDIADSYWQAEPQGVFVPRSVIERLREVHLTQIVDLKRFHEEAAEGRLWDVRYRKALRDLGWSNQIMAKIQEEDRVVSAEITRSSILRDSLKKDIQRLNKEIEAMEKISPGLMKRLAEDAEWKKALQPAAREIEPAPKRYVRLRPMRQVYARRDGDPLPEAYTDVAQPDPWVPNMTGGASSSAIASSSALALRSPQDQPGVLSSVSDIEETRRGLNSIVERLRTLDPLEAPAAPPKAKGYPASLAIPGGDQQQLPAADGRPAERAVLQLRESEETVRRSQAEVRQLRLELQAARGAERAARNETESVRKALSDELKAVRAQQKDGVKREDLETLKAQSEGAAREKDQVIKTLTMQLAAIHANWADDIEKMHQKYQLQLASARAKSPPK